MKTIHGPVRDGRVKHERRAPHLDHVGHVLHVLNQLLQLLLLAPQLGDLLFLGFYVFM